MTVREAEAVRNLLADDSPTVPPLSVRQAARVLGIVAVGLADWCPAAEIRLVLRLMASDEYWAVLQRERATRSAQGVPDA